MNTSTLGSQTEGIILGALVRLEKKILLPFGAGASRYDLALDEGGELIRVQCKTATYKDGCVVFHTCSQRRDHKRIGYKGFADVFGVYCPALDKIYLVPVDDLNENEGRLRVDPTGNNQTKGIRWARDYELSQGPVEQFGVLASLSRMKSRVQIPSGPPEVE